MIKWLKKNKRGIIRTLFLIPIILVATISISHVISWYDLANPLQWAIFLSVAIEIAAMVSLAAASARIKGGVWLVFGIVTLIQLIGNIFYSYKEIDVLSESFKQWVELTGPLFDMMGTEPTDIIGHKRWLAILTGGLLPIISLASLHFFIKYDGSDDEEEPEDKEPKEPTELNFEDKTNEPENNDPKDIVDDSIKIEPLTKPDDTEVKTKAKKPIITNGQIKVEDIKEIKDRGFTKKIPSNKIRKIGSNKEIRSDNPDTVVFRKKK